ncbi:MAG: acyltransferase [Verrucomicrobia bacterium]|nr:acyltransferase [Verrucomicrobiota bacterium]
MIDVIRVLAAWMVVAWHTGGAVNYRLPIFSSASIAVDVFMNVSGFLMLYLFWERRHKEPWERPSTWFKFYVRRFFRIAPLYYVVLLGVIALRLAPPPENGVSPSLWQWLLLRFSFLFGFIPHLSDHCLIPDWSLTLEMQFYCCFPFLALALRRLGAGLFFFCCVVLSGLSGLAVGYYHDAARNHLWYFPQPTILPLKLHIFAVGMVIATAVIDGSTSMKSKWFLAALPVYLLTCKENFLWLMAAVYWSAYAIYGQSRVRSYLLRSVEMVNRALRGLPWRQKLAECSYGTYLIHSVFIVLLLDRFRWRSGNRGNSLGQYLLALVVVLGLTTLTSWILHEWIEKPGIDLGRRIAQRLRYPPQASDAPRAPQ